MSLPGLVNGKSDINNSLGRALTTDHLFIPAPPPTGADAVAALLVLEDGRYLIQLRDDKPDIYYPGHWGLFGGAVEQGEEPLAALHRELAEELRLAPRDAAYFTRFDFDLTCVGQKKVYRIFYVVRVAADELRSLVLSEGISMEAVSGEDLLLNRRVVPYDAFALWLHLRCQNGH
jgi:8-oxo-dGTP pyrophosphatase MutT (NUDIX family)